MKEMFFEFFKAYGWQLTLIGCIGIPVLGIFKYFNVFKKIKKENRKYVYAVISSAFSIAAAAIYLCCIHKFDPAVFGVISVGLYGINQTVYSMYENYGFRAVLKKTFTAIVNVLSKKNASSKEAETEKEKAEAEVEEKKIITVDHIE